MKKNNSEIAMWSEETHIFEVDKSLIMEKDVETKKQISKLMKEGEKFMKKKDLVCAENIYQKMPGTFLRIPVCYQTCFSLLQIPFYRRKKAQAVNLNLSS